MPAPTIAELSRPIPFPTEIGPPLWQERRRFPVAATLSEWETEPPLP